MKIFISTDMEGIAGVVSWNEMKSNNKIYTTMQNTELNWVIELIKESKLNEQVEEIVICDSHSRGENLPLVVFLTTELAGSGVTRDLFI